MYSIGNALLLRVWVSCGDRCATATPTEAVAETELNRLPFRFTLHKFIIAAYADFCNRRRL